MGFFIFLGLLVVLAFVVIAIYNRLVALKHQHKNALAQIDVQLKRRYDLIPNLVETAKSYLSHERETLEAVIAARNSAVKGLQQAKDSFDGEGLQALAAAEGQLQGALSNFNIAVEAYPELKADGTMMQLSEELSSTENKIAFARQAYNDSVMSYNVYKQSFPANILAGAFGHERDAVLLEFEDKKALQQAPQVKF